MNYSPELPVKYSLGELPDRWSKYVFRLVRGCVPWVSLFGSTHI